MLTDPKKVKLTQFSHGAGCGCKIAPNVLDEILHSSEKPAFFKELLVGNKERDDAAVIDQGDGTAIISTTDFFMPIVDDPLDFGRIASVNAISDVYAMGGYPLMAIAILGWPVDQLSAAIANQVVAGSRQACLDAGIPLAGGHSIDSPEPIFGLAVTGKVAVKHLKKNGGAKAGDVLLLTKPLGVGILSTAQKKGKLLTAHNELARNSMIQLNRIGAKLGELPEVHAMTDITGFGLFGHLTEMCAASETSAKIEFGKIPLLDRSAIDYYLKEKCIPGGTHRNWKSYGEKIEPITDYEKFICCDPQTSGGLLAAVDPSAVAATVKACAAQNVNAYPIGEMVKQEEKLVYLSN